MIRLRIFISTAVASMSPLTKGLCSGFVATATVAAGGAATINDETTVALKLYVGGIIAACTVGIWVGTRVGKLLELVNTLKRIERHTNHLHNRIRVIENNCPHCHPNAMSNTTQKIEISQDS